VKYLSAKNIAWIIIAAAIIGSAFIFAQSGKSTDIPLEENAQIQTASTSTTSPIVYDGNWQKTLVGTVGSSSWSVANTSQAQEKLTLTQQFGRDIIGKYLALKEAGTSADPQSQQELVGQILSDGTFVVKPTLHTIKEIKIKKDSSKAAITQYGNAVGAIFSHFILPKAKAETDIVQESLDNKDPKILDQLDPTITNYKNTIAALLTIDTPQSLADMHLGMINGIAEILFADQSFKKISSDGIVGLQGIGIFQEGVTQFSTSFTSFIVYLKVNGITFTPQEYGYIFTNKNQ
jgi:hypothetical protein